jgi:peptidoglycan/LPS O-acetylase OafA/YrhL
MHARNVEYRPDIDGLRAIAVLSVVCFHAFPAWAHGGFVGVDIFFVISGFLISSIIFSQVQSDSFSFLEFYSRRIRRIIPALAIVLITCLTAGWLLLWPNEYTQLGNHITAGAIFLSNFLLWKEAGYFDDASVTKPLLHLWSLGIEEQFYIVWPALVFFTRSRGVKFLVLVAIIAIASFVLNVSSMHYSPVAVFYSPFTRFWELMIGCALAYVTLTNIRPFARKSPKHQNCTTDLPWFSFLSLWTVQHLQAIKAWSGIALILAAIVFTNERQLFPGWWALLPTLGACLLIWAGPDVWFNRAILSNRLMVFVGLISYPLYLWHWPLLSYTYIIEAGTPSREIRILLVFVSILFAWITYLIIERPVRYGRYTRAKAVGLLLLLLTIGAVGFNARAQSGFPSRFPDFAFLRALVTFNYDVSVVYRQHQCFLEPDEDETKFNGCVEEYRSERPLLLLWGDSYAAHLLPGVKKWFPEFRIAQFTASGCPPILGYESNIRPHCGQILKFIALQIHKLRPDKILMAAGWTGYPDDVITARLADTIASLQRAGSYEVAIVGPVPTWSLALPKLLYEHMIHDVLRHELPPERIRDSIPQWVFETDNRMSTYFSALNIVYISPLKLLCNAEGCLARVGDTVDSIIAWDNAHLTAKGSEFIVGSFWRRIAGRLPP